jgi:membrane-anchored protein YejM (alkaline phosphatase superfamily)
MLPWKKILVKIQERYLPLKQTLHLKPPLQRKDLAFNTIKAQSLPNIYLIISESIRGDYINSINAPSLFAFKKECTSSQISRSSANCTHLSWFSIFHSKYPFYWSYNKTQIFEEGSLPLNLLKELGYSIHVYSAAQLRFYHFDEVIFGKHHHLTSTFKVFPHYGEISAAEADKAALTALMDDSLFHKNYGNVYILFLDSTHFNYSWPKDFETPFDGSNELSWLHRLSTKQQHLDIIKNRYRNSIYYVDSLFDQLTKKLKKQAIYDESFIVFCGDHGEEFKEQAMSSEQKLLFWFRQFMMAVEAKT